MPLGLWVKDAILLRRSKPDLELLSGRGWVVRGEEVRLSECLRGEPVVPGVVQTLA